MVEAFGNREGILLTRRVRKAKLGLREVFGDREEILLEGRVGKSELG